MQEKNRNGRQSGQFISIETKISKRIGWIVSISCILLGVIISILSYISSISAVSETIDSTSNVAAAYVAASLKTYISVAYETGNTARLSDPDRTVEEKRNFLSKRSSITNLMAVFY